VRAKNFFKKPTLRLGNPFKEATLNLERTMVKDGHIKAGHDKAFKPAKIVQEKVKASYDHITELIEKKRHPRDEDGKIIIAPRNIVTNPPKTGTQYKRTTFSPFPEFIADDYENAKKLATKEFKENLTRF
jgi:hypothetical protein